MNKAHSSINWENYPSDETPLNKRNLNKMDSAIEIIDDRVITLDTTKATKTEVATLVADVNFEESTGIITITKKNGSRVTIDTQMEKIAVNFTYNPTTQQIILTLIDGTKQYIDLSALITQYEFLDTDTVAFIIGTDGKVSAIVKEGSIKEKHLEPNYLAKIKVEAAKAETSASNAATSEDNARSAAEAAQASATAAGASESNAQASAASAAQSEANARASENSAKSSRDTAVESAQTATEKAESASESATTASEKADIATRKATEIIGKAEAAAESATKAQSYAVGGTGSRDGEDSDNAKYYYQQAKDVSEGLKGGLQPHGTVAFSDLPALADVNSGWMFNISDEFATTDDFKEGAGNVIPAGANIYKTSDGKWDVLAGTPVTGIKGANEATYRRGNVNLTPENLGLGKVDNTADTEKTVKSAGTADKLGTSAGSATRPVYFKDGKPTQIDYTLAEACKRGVKSATAVTHTDFNTNNDYVPDMRFLAFWNGAYNADGNSNLARCNHGAFGTMATKNASDYMPKSGGAFTGEISVPDNKALKAGSKVLVMTTEEGGNIAWQSPNGTKYEMDSFSNEFARIYSGDGDKHIFRLYANGRFDTFYLQSDNGALRDRTGDNQINSGTSGHRWKQVYAGAATISTSDRNFKKDIKELNENHLKFFLLLTPVSFQFIDGDSGRTHIGFIAQDVEDAMAQCGLTALDFAGFCKDVKVQTVPVEKEVELEDGTIKTYTDYVDEAVLDADGNPKYIYSLRYEEFIALVTYATQKLYKKVDEMEARMERMEDRLAALEK